MQKQLPRHAEDMYTSEGTGHRRTPSPLLVRAGYSDVKSKTVKILMYETGDMEEQKGREKVQ